MKLKQQQEKIIQKAEEKKKKQAVRRKPSWMNKHELKLEQKNASKNAFPRTLITDRASLAGT